MIGVSEQRYWLILITVGIVASLIIIPVYSTMVEPPYKTNRAAKLASGQAIVSLVFIMFVIIGFTANVLEIRN